MPAKPTAGPKYLDVSAAIEAEIRKGAWDGGRLPGVRGVARAHNVSVVTATRALQVLRDKGLVRTVGRSGVYRVPPPDADRWAVVLRLTPGPWQQAVLGVARLGFDALARREPMFVDYDALPVDPAAPPAEVQRVVKRAAAAGVRGAFLLPSRHSDAEAAADERLLAACRAEGLPVVLLERNLRGRGRPLGHDLVAVDDLDGAACCTRHLLAVGRTRVALVVASPTSSHDDRVAGYLRAVHEAAHAAPRPGVEYRPRVLYQAHDLPTREAFARLADEVVARGIDGVACYEDYTAVGLIMELLARRIAVPGDVAVAGFDDLPIGDAFPIGVTTYAYPGEAMAEQAVRLMRDRLRHPDRPPVKVVVPGRLVVRESTAGGPAGPAPPRGRGKR